MVNKYTAVYSKTCILVGTSIVNTLHNPNKAIKSQLHEVSTFWWNVLSGLIAEAYIWLSLAAISASISQNWVLKMIADLHSMN